MMHAFLISFAAIGAGVILGMVMVAVIATRERLRPLDHETDGWVADRVRLAERKGK